MDFSNKDIDKLPYSLHRLSYILQRLADDQLRSHLGIGAAQLKILVAVDDLPGCEQRQLARKLGLTEAGISRQVKLMNKSEWLEVQKDRNDGRRRNLYLTPKGRHTLIRAQRLLDDYYQELFGKLPAQELEILNKSLIRVSELI